MVSKHQPKHGDHFWQPRYSRRFDVFSSPNDFHFFLVFQHVETTEVLKKKSWKTWRIDGSWKSMVRVASAPESWIHRGVGVRLLCRSQILLRPLTAERSTESPVAKNGVCFGVATMGCAPDKNNIIWFILILAFVLAWHIPKSCC